MGRNDAQEVTSVSCPVFKQRFYVKYDSCNTRLLPESVCGIQVLNGGNRIEFLLA